MEICVKHGAPIGLKRDISTLLSKDLHMRDECGSDYFWNYGSDSYSNSLYFGTLVLSECTSECIHATQIRARKRETARIEDGVGFSICTVLTAFIQAPTKTEGVEKKAKSR